MSEIWLPTSPAYLSLKPSSSDWLSIETELRNIITHWLQCSEQSDILRLSSSAEAPLGYYQVFSTPPFFVKVLPVSQIKQQLGADKIAQWLFQEGLEVSTLLSGFPKFSLDGHLAILAYPLVKSRFVENNIEDISVLGETVGKMHGMLRSCPWKKEIKENGRLRQRKLLALWQQIRAASLSLDIPPAALAILKSAKLEDFLLLDQNAQVVHGDLNYGNVIVCRKNHHMVILDFEDTCTAWFNPLMELAFIIERFVINESDEQSLHLSKVLIRTYNKANHSTYSEKFNLAALLRGLSIRSLLLLCSIVKNGGSVESEWNKFIQLYDQTISRSTLLAEISAVVEL